VVLELDCSVRVDVIKGKVRDKSPLVHLISEIGDIINGSRLISIVKVDRVYNWASHCLANYAKVEAKIDLWLGRGPKVWSLVLNHDLLEISIS
jgi:hypothetical protein